MSLFNVDSIRAELITVKKEYPGTRFYFTGYLDTIEHNMSIDIGFGDVVTPCPESVDFPLLLPDNPSINRDSHLIPSI